VSRSLRLALALLAAASAARAERVLRVGVFEQSPIVTVAEDEVREPALFNRILDHVAERERWRIVLVPGDLPSLLGRLEDGEIDLLPAVPYAKELEERVRFGLESVVSTWAQIHTQSRLPVQSLLDLSGRAVGVVRDDPYNAELRRIAAQFNMECRFVEFGAYGQVLDGLSKRWIDAAVVDRLYAAGRTLPDDVVASHVVFAPVQLRFAAPRDSGGEILDTLDYHLHAMKANPVSVYHTMLGRMLGERGDGRSMRVVLPILGGLAAVAFLSAGAAFTLKRQVRGRTRDLSRANEALRQEVVSRGQAEAALRDTNQMLQKTLESMLDGLLILNPGVRTVLAWNRTALRLFNVEPDGLSNHPLDEFVSDPGANGGVKERIAIEILAKGSFSGEVRLRRAGGAVFPAEIRVAPLDERNPAGAWVAVIRDIGDRVRAEEGLREAEAQLRQAQKMEALGTLAGGIAHDLNNMLTPILGYAEMLDMGAENEQEARTYCEHIHRAALRAKSLVRQILTFSRASPPERHPVALSPIVHETAQLLRATLPVNIAIEICPETPGDVVLADPSQIQQILMNLAANAGHAMRDTGGRLTIALGDHRGPVRGIAGELEPVGDSFVRLTVRDSGPGIPPDVLARIFDPFFTTKRKGEGTGMGLAVVHGIVKSYGGTIEVETAPGHGAAFHIYLPGVLSAPHALGAGSTAARAGDGRILIVDDERPITDMARLILSRCGYSVTAFNDPREALATFEARPRDYNVVVTDFSMPHLTGADLVQAVFAIRPGIPVVLCTGYSESMTRERAAEMGIRRYIMKPFTADELTAAVAELIPCGARAAPAPRTPDAHPPAARSPWRDEASRCAAGCDRADGPA
jgi:PAS domain S-box-containing protein